MRDLILRTTRTLMAEHGTAGLSIRLIAREVDLSPAALYHYFPNLDALITALIVAGYRDLADTLEAAAAASSGLAALDAIARAYRAWALSRPTDFQLLFGTPIPGYVAPQEQTVPAVVAVHTAIMRAVALALRSGLLRVPSAFAHTPPAMGAHIDALIADGRFPITPSELLAGFSFQAWMHGAVMLELMGHTTPTLGDAEAFYAMQHAAWLYAFGAPAFGGGPGP